MQIIVSMFCKPHTHSYYRSIDNETYNWSYTDRCLMLELDESEFCKENSNDEFCLTSTSLAAIVGDDYIAKYP